MVPPDLVLLFVTMATTSLRQHLLNGGRSYGPVSLLVRVVVLPSADETLTNDTNASHASPQMIMSDSPIITEILSLAGYGHIVIDHEHSPTDVKGGQLLLQSIQAANAVSAIRTEPIVRVPSHNDPVYMKKVLDTITLPGGVLVPMVDDAETAEAVVRSTRYPARSDSATDIDGVRGCAAPFVRGSSWGLNQEYLQTCQDDLLVMVQVETAAGVKAIPEIAAVPGVDAIFLGPMDLSCSVGKMGQFDDPEVSKLMADAEMAVLASEDCLLAGFRSPGRSLQDIFDSGYSLVCGSLDIGLLREAARRDAEAAAKILGNV